MFSNDINIYFFFDLHTLKMKMRQTFFAQEFLGILNNFFSYLIFFFFYKKLIKIISKTIFCVNKRKRKPTQKKYLTLCGKTMMIMREAFMIVWLLFDILKLQWTESVRGLIIYIHSYSINIQNILLRDHFAHIILISNSWGVEEPR